MSAGFKTIAIGVPLLLVAIVVAMNAGPADTNLLNMFSNDEFLRIAFKYRFPRILLGASVGMALSSCGAVYQGLLQNPLADPYLLGVSGGAALGTALAIGFNLPIGFIPILSFAFAIGSMAIVSALSSRQGVRSLLLTGVVFNAFAFALVLFFNSIFSQRQAYEMLFFLMGNLDASSWKMTLICTTLSLSGTIFLAGFGRSLDAASFGDELACSMGVPLRLLKTCIIFISAIMIGTSVAAAGMIGFVGLFVPHAMRSVVGASHKWLIISSGLAGAGLLVLADSFARSQIAYKYLGGELPVGVLTALIGAPLFFWLIKKDKRI